MEKKNTNFELQFFTKISKQRRFLGHFAKSYKKRQLAKSVKLVRCGNAVFSGS